MSEELKIKVSYEVDESNLNKSLAKVHSNSSKALSGGASNLQSNVDKSLAQTAKLQDRFKVLVDAQKSLAAQPGMERSLARVNQELAGVASYYKRTATDSASYLKNLEREVALRKEATQLTNLANRNEGNYSAHSQRQFAMLQQISGQVPGGGILNKFLSGARSGAMAEGEGAGLLGRGGLAGGGMVAAAAAAALAVGALVSKEMELAARSAELAQSAGNASSQMGQLRSQIERTAISKDIAATSPTAVSIAGIKSWFEQQGNDFLTNLTTSPADKQRGLNAKISQGLGGDAKESWRRTVEQRGDMELDLARNRQAVNEQFRRTDRDFALEQKKWQVDTARQVQDIQKQAYREDRDHQIAKQQFDENFAGKMAARQFDLQQQYAQQAYQISRNRSAQDFQISQQDRAYDFGVSRSRSTQDFSLSQQDKQYDFWKSLSRNQTEYNINKGRQGEDYSESLQKAVLGGANGMDLMWMSRDYRKAQQRQQTDFERSKALATEDYGLSAGRDLRGFAISQSRGAEDYNLAQSREGRGFSLAQQRGAQDFSISQQQAVTARNMEIETETYNRKYQSLALEIQHADALKDIVTAETRLAQNIGFDRQGFANKAGDLAYDKNTAYRDLGISDLRARRAQGYGEQDLAGAIRKSDPLGAYGQSLTDPAFAKALAGYTKATGQLDLGQQIKASQGLDFGSIGGHALNFPGASLGSFLRLLGVGNEPGFNGMKGLDKSPQINVNINAGNNSFNLDPNLGPQVQSYVDKQLDALRQGVEDLLRRQYGG